MDRPTTAVQPPIALESRPLPSGPTPDLVRRRGRGYGPAADTEHVFAPKPAGNRASRRRAARRATGRSATMSRLRLAALLVAPAGTLLAASPSFATPSSSSSTPTTLTVDDPSSTSTSTDPSTPSSSQPDDPSTSTTDESTTTTSASTSGPTSGTTTTTSGPTTTVPATTTTGSRPPSTVTTVRTGSTTSTTSTTDVDDSTTSTSSTVAPATEPLPVGTPELPPETATDADPVAVAASQALELHAARTAATAELSAIAERRAFADVRANELETRVSGLTGLAFEYAQQGQPTADVEAARAAAQDELAIVRTEQALLSLQEAATGTIVDDLTARHDDARKALAALVTQRAGGDSARLDGVWATTSDARLDVVYAALAQVGDPYVWATDGPDTFDCSGLTEFAWKAAGVTLEHYTVTQRQMTLDVAEGNLRPGDLVFNLNGPNGGHVMLFLGIGHTVVHAPAPGQLVSVSEWRTTTGFGSPIADDELAAVELDDDAATVTAQP